MNRGALLCYVSILIVFGSRAQNFNPIATSGYTLDAIAENTTALATTSGPLDGSNFALYSAAYGALYNVVGGLPNSGVISSAGYSFQLQPYNQNNVLFMMAGQNDSLVLNTPASYAALSLLGFATEGDGTMNITLRFTDNSTQVFTNLSLFDWFNGSTAILSGFGRVSRTSGAITNPAGNPKLFNTNLYLNCANRSKLVQNIKIQNTSGNARICILAAAASAAPSYTPVTNPVSCAGGNNGTASVSIANSLPPNSYTWASVPPQNAGMAFNLTAGVYSFTLMDGAGCMYSSSVSIGVSTVPLAPLQVATTGTLVCPGTAVTLSGFGAATYTWSNGQNSPVTSVTPAANSTYSVVGTTAANCLISGSVFITTHTVQPVSINPIGAMYCISASSIALAANPPGGSFSGAGVNGSVFSPSTAGIGTVTITYVYTDANACSSSQSLSTVIHPLPQVSFSLPNPVFCLNSGTVVLNATPTGGNYSGNGVSGNIFNPALHNAGNSVLSYTYTDANACSNFATAWVTVNALPLVSFGPVTTVLCIRASSVNLSATPLGGTFSGPGVVGAAFSPTMAGLGTHQIVYSYTDAATSCSNSATHSITVSACTGLWDGKEEGESLFRVFPNPSTGDLFLSSEVNGRFELYGLTGQVLMSVDLIAQELRVIELKGLTEGVYTICFISALGRFNKSLLVIH